MDLTCHLDLRLLVPKMSGSLWESFRVLYSYPRPLKSPTRDVPYAAQCIAILKGIRMQLHHVHMSAVLQ